VGGGGRPEQSAHSREHSLGLHSRHGLTYAANTRRATVSTAATRLQRELQPQGGCRAEQRSALRTPTPRRGATGAAQGSSGKHGMLNTFENRGFAVLWPYQGISARKGGEFLPPAKNTADRPQSGAMRLRHNLEIPGGRLGPPPKPNAPGCAPPCIIGPRGRAARVFSEQFGRWNLASPSRNAGG